MDDRPDTGSQPLALSSGAATALVHLYRGELGRLTAYRRRLDTTTNWAISFATGAVSLTLGTEVIPHTVAVIAMLLTSFFLVLEAGRFRHYEVSRIRVRLLESHYFPGALHGDPDKVWVERLIDHLRRPRPPFDLLTAIGWRLQRTYLWIYGAILASWLLKLELSGEPAGSPAALIGRASIGTLPGWTVFGAVLTFLVLLIGLAIMSVRRYPQPEDW